VVAHHEQPCVALLHRFSVELKRALVKPSRPWFLIVFEGEPEVGKLLNFPVVGAAEVYDVGYAEGLERIQGAARPGQQSGQVVGRAQPIIACDDLNVEPR
jgi:hypothetical protein